MLYDYIKGELTTITPKSVTIESYGIGYLILMANPFELQSSLHQTVKLFVHHHVREDDELLFGFLDQPTRTLFEQLISVSGIGPKSALSILASEHQKGFIKAVETADQTFLTRFPGVGKKTAAQIILDLKGKLGSYDSEEKTTKKQSAEDERVTDVALALSGLGYSQREIDKIKKNLIPESNESTEQLLKRAFKLLLDK